MLRFVGIKYLFLMLVALIVYFSVAYYGPDVGYYLSIFIGRLVGAFVLIITMIIGIIDAVVEALLNYLP